MINVKNKPHFFNKGIEYCVNSAWFAFAMHSAKPFKSKATNKFFIILNIGGKCNQQLMFAKMAACISYMLL